MSQLIQAYDAYNDFGKDPYFVLCFGCLPSKLWFNTPLEAGKKNMERVLELLDPTDQDLEVVYRHWTTEDASNADGAKDYPYEYLFKSRNQKLLIWVCLRYEDLEVNFYYDQADSELEKWVTDLNQQLRTTLGIDKAPVFKVLSHNQHNFYTEDIRTNDIHVDVQKHYNDDFEEVDRIILHALNEEKAGLILLHGDPGTGKTTYIKSLITRFAEKTFIFIQNEFVNELLHPDFISFMLKNRNAILIIEDAEKVIMSRDNANENSVVSTILQLTDGLFSDYLNIKIICTFNTSIDRIDKALLRKGRMIAYYDFKPLAAEKANELMEDLGLESQDESMTLADIFNSRDREFRQNGQRKIGFQR